MYKKYKVGVVVPAYNEERLISKTIESVPSYVDNIVVINDGSKDDTLKVITKLEKKNKKIIVINNEKNGGIGFSLKRGIKKASELGCDRIAIMAGDAQMDPKYLHLLIDEIDKKDLDFVKANRFMHFDALKNMPRFRRVGNIVVTILTKFATGYYTIFDTQNGYVVYTKDIVDRLPWRLIGDRYEFENTILIALSIVNAKIADYPIPAYYGEEKSTIKLGSTVARVLKVLFIGYWRRIVYKYVIYGFHPIALFVFSGLFFLLISLVSSAFIIASKIISDTTPTSASVMLVALPFLVGFQMLLTALILDVIEEQKP